MTSSTAHTPLPREAMRLPVAVNMDSFYDARVQALAGVVACSPESSAMSEDYSSSLFKTFDNIMKNISVSSTPQYADYLAGYDGSHINVHAADGVLSARFKARQSTVATIFLFEKSEGKVLTDVYRDDIAMRKNKPELIVPAPIYPVMALATVERIMATTENNFRDPTLAKLIRLAADPDHEEFVRLLRCINNRSLLDWLLDERIPHI
ncbi:MAG: hypothetical protein JWO47_650 [Candidatus Saccharibacteria bacterium]|nr:hypothetical protein [Candidatus Saccharibacteria bacterium]